MSWHFSQDNSISLPDLKPAIYTPTLLHTIGIHDNIVDSQHRRITRSVTESLPAPRQHYNDLDLIAMFISLNEIKNAISITNPPLSLPSTLDYETLLYDCFLSTPPSFCHVRLITTSQSPNTYKEAISQLDSDIWMAAMKRELNSLEERKAFERATLPPGHKAIGLRWTYDFKYHPNGTVIQGKEKACLVAQGFSVHLLLAFTNHHDLEIMSFDVKTAFLHAHLPHDIYAKQIPSFPESNPTLVLRILVTLYGLKQLAYEWYKLLASTFFDLGLSL